MPASGENFSKILANPMNISWGVTVITPTHPHTGGVGLGVSNGVTLSSNLEIRYQKTEEYGEEEVDGIYVGASPTITIELLQWDDAAVQRAFPGGLSSAGVAERLVAYPGTLKPGTKASTMTDVLMMTPLDTTNQKAIICYSAFPILASEADLFMGTREDLVLRITFKLFRDATDRVMEIGKLSDLTPI